MCKDLRKNFSLFKEKIAMKCPCQCPTLRTVSYIIAGINVFFSALFTIRVLVHLAIYNHAEPKLPESNEVEAEELKLGFSTLLILLVIGVAWFGSSLLLIKGIYQERFKLMSWWIYINYFLMAIIFGTAAIAFIADCIYWTTFGDVFKKFILYLMGSGLSFLFFYPVFLFYKRLQFNTEQQALKDSVIVLPTTPDTHVKDFYASEKPDNYESEKLDSQEFE